MEKLIEAIKQYKDKPNIDCGETCPSAKPYNRTPTPFDP